MGALSTASIHTIHDLLPTLSEKAMGRNVEFAVRIIGDVANAAVVPVKKGMPEDTRKELDKYFHRDKDKDKEMSPCSAPGPESHCHRTGRNRWSVRPPLSWRNSPPYPWEREPGTMLPGRWH